MTDNRNLDLSTVASFGDEWQRFDQQLLTPSESKQIFNDYFSIFPWNQLPQNSVGFDMGCGSGRWAQFVAPLVGTLHCIDPSSALNVARKSLADFPNINFHQGSVASSGLNLNSQDFGYSLGVLHHVPDTEAAIRSCVDLLKPGAPLLLYLYYSFDNRPRWFRLLWLTSNVLRITICHLPGPCKQLLTDLIAFFVYWPLARLSALIEKLGVSVNSFPLSYYRYCSFYTMRTDSRDRFGTPLERRFTRSQIAQMCINSGLEDLRFSSSAPFWCVVGFKIPNV